MHWTVFPLTFPPHSGFLALNLSSKDNLWCPLYVWCAAVHICRSSSLISLSWGSTVLWNSPPPGSRGRHGPPIWSRPCCSKSLDLECWSFVSMDWLLTAWFWFGHVTTWNGQWGLRWGRYHYLSHIRREICRINPPLACMFLMQHDQMKPPWNHACSHAVVLFPMMAELVWNSTLFVECFSYNCLFCTRGACAVNAESDPVHMHWPSAEEGGGGMWTRRDSWGEGKNVPFSSWDWCRGIKVGSIYGAQSTAMEAHVGKKCSPHDSQPVYSGRKCFLR